MREAGRRDELGDLASTINLMADDLEAVDRHRKELVANVSHELRTPISALRAVLENVVDGVSAADPETMRTMLKQTERLGRLVETLLDLSRVDNGVVPLKARRFEVWPYLSGVLKESGLAAAGRPGLLSGSGGHTRNDVHLHLDVFPPELTAYADAERLHQVVANLIDNAVKHSPRTAGSRSAPGQAMRPAVWRWRCGTKVPASRKPSGTGSSSGSTGAARGPATAAPGWAWRSPAGPWSCTEGISAWPNRHGAAASSSRFRAARRRRVDVGFEWEGHDLGHTYPGSVRGAKPRGPQPGCPLPEPRLFPAIPGSETRRSM